MQDEISSRRLEIVAVITGVIFITVLVFAVQGWGNSPEPAPPAAAVSQAPSPPSPPPASPPAPPPSSPTPAASSPPPAPAPSPSPSPAAATVRWRGTITLAGVKTAIDLDTVPPRAGGEPDIAGDWLKTSIRAADGRVRLALAAGNPGAKACTETAAAGSTQIEQVATGDVVCALTSGGRTVRLEVTYATQLADQPIVRMKATIWDPAGAGEGT